MNKEKFNTIIKENYALLYRLCNAYLKDKSEIEDLLQEIYINIWNHLENFRAESKISTWIYRIAINTALMYNRKTQKRNKVFAELVESKTAIPNNYETNEENNEKLQVLKRCINKLKEQDRIVITLLLEGLKYEEISEVIGISINNVGVKINRAKSKLAKLMEEKSYE